jgi:hypothetical protein
LAHLPPLDHPGEQVLHGCAVAAAGSASQAARRAPDPARHISAMTAATLSAVTRGQICFGAGMVYTAAGVSRAGDPWSL